MLSWIEDFLTDRYSCVRSDQGNSIWKHFKYGVPQGSILSPFLFLIYIDDLFDDIESIGFLFADDGALIQVSDDQEEVITGLNNDLERISRWSLRWRLFFSPKKFQLLVFGSKRYFPNLANVTLTYNGQTIIGSEFVIYLGFKIDCKLNWNTHIEWILTRCKKKFNILLMLRKYVSGYLLRIIYKCYVISDAIWITDVGS